MTQICYADQLVQFCQFWAEMLVHVAHYSLDRTLLSIISLSSAREKTQHILLLGRWN